METNELIKTQIYVFGASYKKTKKAASKIKIGDRLKIRKEEWYEGDNYDKYHFSMHVSHEYAPDIGCFNRDYRDIVDTNLYRLKSCIVKSIKLEPEVSMEVEVDFYPKVKKYFE